MVTVCSVGAGSPPKFITYGIPMLISLIVKALCGNLICFQSSHLVGFENLTIIDIFYVEII
jgi:hypothetical protein